MDSITQFLLSLLTGLVIAAFTSWITVRLALKQFYSQRWWERKAEAYSKVIEALYHVKHNLQILLQGKEEGAQVPDERRKELDAKSRMGYEEIDMAEGIGAFVISDSVAESLTRLRLKLGMDNTNRSWFEFLDEKVTLVENHLAEIRELAKRDLGIRKSN